MNRYDVETLANTGRELVKRAGKNGKTVDICLENFKPLENEKGIMISYYYPDVTMRIIREIEHIWKTYGG